MKPKMLPWLARSAGLPIERVEALWEEAKRHAAKKTGSIDTSAYFAAAQNRLLQSVQNEAVRFHPPQMTPWILINTRLGALPLVAANGFAKVWSAAWARLADKVRHAA